MVVVLHVAPQLLSRSLGVELRVPLHRLHQPVVAVDRCVVRQHVDDEPLLDGLLHRVGVEGNVFRSATLRDGRAEYLQRLVLGRRGEGEVAGVGQHLLALHDAVDLVLGGLVLFFAIGLPQRRGHRRRRATALAGMRFVDDDGETASPVLVADGVQDEGELLHRGDGDAFALLQEGAKLR